MAASTDTTGRTDPRRRFANTGYAGLDFIKAAFCPLEFNARPFGEHPEYRKFARDDALAALEVGEPLHYPRQFPFTDIHGHRKTGTQIVTAPFGLAPADFDLFLGLFTYLKKLPEIPADGRVYLTVDFIARQLKLPATCQKDYLRLRSRLFRVSFAKYANSAFWNPETRSHDLVNFGFWNLAALSRLTESRRPVVLEWDRTLSRLLEHSAFLAFDYELYRDLSPALRRLYLIANRDGWNQRDSSIYLADEFAVHQIGYGDRPAGARDRLHKLKRLLAEAQDRDLIRPSSTWNSAFLRPVEQGKDKGRVALRWSRGPALRARQDEPERVYTDRVENDALFAQVQELRDEEGKPATPVLFRRLVSRYGREPLQKHVLVVLAQKELHPGSFQRSEVAALVDRLQHDYPEPDWYRALKRAERVSPFAPAAEEVPSQLSMEMFDTFFR
jgi:hypothetical protein